MSKRTNLKDKVILATGSITDIGEGMAPLLRSLEDVGWAAVYFFSDVAVVIHGAVQDLEQYRMIGRNRPTES